MLSGIIEEFGVHNTVQLAELMGATGRLSLQTQEGEFALHYEQGVLVHAEAGSRRGDEAVVYLLQKAKCGRFELDQTARTDERTVTKEIQLLVLMAAKAQDEEKAAEAKGPQKDKLGEQLEELVASLRLRFACFVSAHGEPTVRINPESSEAIDVHLLCSMTDSYLSKVEVERMLGVTSTYQFAIGRAAAGWLFLGSSTDIPLAMLGTMLRKGIAQIEGDPEAQKASVQQSL
jgi:hypothetical protein